MCGLFAFSIIEMLGVFSTFLSEMFSTFEV